MIDQLDRDAAELDAGLPAAGVDRGGAEETGSGDPSVHPSPAPSPLPDELAKQLDEPDAYVPIAAKRVSICPHCPESIQPGEAIVLREGEDDYCHLDCARFEDELDRDPIAVLDRERAEWQRKHGPRTRRKRKARKSTA